MLPKNFFNSMTFLAKNIMKRKVLSKEQVLKIIPLLKAGLFT